MEKLHENEYKNTNKSALNKMATDRIKQLMSFLEKEPTDGFTLYSLAYEHLKGGDLNKAEIYFNRLKSLDPMYVGLYYHLGKIYHQRETMG